MNHKKWVLVAVVFGITILLCSIILYFKNNKKENKAPPLSSISTPVSFIQNSFTPTLQDFIGNNLSGTSSGYFSQIGTIITISLDLIWTGKGVSTETDDLLISNIPNFTGLLVPLPTIQYILDTSWIDGINNITKSNKLICIFQNSTTIKIAKMQSVDNELEYIKISDLSTSGNIQLSGTYFIN